MTFQVTIIMITIILIYWTLTMTLCKVLSTESSQPHKVDAFIPIVIIIIIMRKLRVKG